MPVSLARNSAAAETKTERSGGAGRKVGLGEMNFYQPAPLQILGEICSNFFERTPPASDLSIQLKSNQKASTFTYLLKKVWLNIEPDSAA